MSVQVYSEVTAVFESYPDPLRQKLLALRDLILQTASTTEGVGEVVETLKWGQPSYLTVKPKSGTTIRIAEHAPQKYGLYVHCQTALIETFKQLYPAEFTYDGDRAIVFHETDVIPEEPLRHCIQLALTYHLHKK